MSNEISGLENAEITESVTNNKPYDNYMKEVKALVPEEKQESFISIIKEVLNKNIKTSYESVNNAELFQQSFGEYNTFLEKVMIRAIFKFSNILASV